MMDALACGGITMQQIALLSGYQSEAAAYLAVRLVSLMSEGDQKEFLNCLRDYINHPEMQRRVELFDWAPRKETNEQD